MNPAFPLALAVCDVMTDDVTIPMGCLGVEEVAMLACWGRIVILPSCPALILPGIKIPEKYKYVNMPVRRIEVNKES